ncbi:MAG: PAS domain-containing protein [Alphaproteobacteria bacterium]|nr:PAS domain-containing protein [Alphaproteobacteria bacterium]
MFPLQRYFSLFSLVGVIVASVALGYFFRSMAFDLALSSAEQRAQEYNFLLLHLVEHHLPSLDRQILITPDQLSEGGRARLNEVLKSDVEHLPLMKLKLYTLDGITAYSSDPSEIGKPVDDHTLFQKALLGQTAIKYRAGGRMWRLGDSAQSKHVMEIYSPICNRSGNVATIAEFYVDASGSFDHLDRNQARMMLGTVGIMLGLYLLLFLLIRHAGRTLKNQHDTIQEEMRDQARMAQALLDSEHRLRLITDALPVLIAYIDREMKFRFVNRAYQDWFGHPPWELAGKRLDEVPGIDELARLTVHIGPDMTLGQELCLEAQVKTQEGKRRDVHATFLPHMNPEGDVLGFFSLVHDVTAQKEAEKALRRSNAEMEAKILERTQELSLEISERRLSETRILSSQTALKAMYNITSSQEMSFADKVRGLIEFGTHHFELPVGFLARIEERRLEIQFATNDDSDLTPGHVFDLEEPIDMAKEGPIVQTGDEPGDFMDRACHHLFGFKSYLGARVQVGGKPYGMLAFASRATPGHELRPTDREIIRLMAQWIGGEIARVQSDAEMRAAREKAEEASVVKSEFLATISHELRTPLNAIIGFSELMTMKAFGPLGHSNYEDYLKSIHDSGQHLLKIINDILDVSKIEAGKLELQDDVFDLVEAGHEAMRLIEHKAREGSLRLSEELPPTVLNMLGDRRRILQILLNLLSNAIKFTPEGGLVTLSMTSLDDQRLRITISDTGIGMAPKDIEKALTPFGQVDSKLSRSHEGTGLGLPLTKSLVELHDGVFEIISTPWVGTKVLITFPAERTR